ncbi:GGDEF domain-containing protein [Inhella crocodyli]|uniref:diguanylate cyclase n=1 Tax=Inhella crocodyli TaxID=2499851 RepID=A0A3S2V1L1_9BURK|nr:GGDEF domain-containing protein [Inhella crocodyli]RVT86115.1 GGDEF domain-containing protein [Inhella crocodyli]
MTDAAASTPDDRRAAIAQSAVVVAASAVCQLVFLWVGRQAGTPWPWLLAAAGAAFGGLVLLHLLIRSGWSERLEDPSLSQAHIQYGTLSMAIAYPLMGVYGSLVLPLAVALLTFGVFALRGRQFTGLALWALGVLGTGMAVAVLGWPRQVPGDLALGQFMALCIAMPSIAWFAARISVLRHRLEQQRSELSEALVRIEHLATRDALTGLANRRHAEAVLDQTLRRQRRGGRPAALALVDLDHFKRVNDRHGHAVGDAVLVAFARAAESALRDTDLVARWGGEEFLLLLEGSDPLAAESALARLRATVAELAVSAGDEILRFTFSAGLTPWQAGDTAARWLDRADRALYEAKAAGRDRTVLA